MKSEKCIHILFLIIFALIIFFIAVVPQFKHSGLVPSLNSKIHDVLEKETVEKIEVSYVTFISGIVGHDKQSLIPFTISVDVIDDIKKILEHPTVDDGFIRGSVTEGFILDFYLLHENTSELSCMCIWDSERSIMEIRFNDNNNNMKNDFYSINATLAEELFSYIIVYVEEDFNQIF